MLTIRSTRRLATVVAITALALGACGGGDETAATTAPTTAAQPAATDPSTTETAATDPSASEVSVTTGETAPDSTAGGATCQEIEHALGTTCVPEHPQRVVALDALMVLPTLLEVGVTPVGSVSVYDVGDPFQDYLDPAVADGIETLGSMQTPNIEAIAALRPDVILGTDLVIGPIQEQLEQIAPVVATRYSFYYPDWLTDARLIALSVGKSTEFEAVVAGLDAHIEEVAAVLAERGAPATLSRVDMFAGTPLYYRFGCVWFGSLLNDVGISQPAAQQPDACTPGDYQSVIQYPSLEQLDVLDADVIVAYQQQAAGADVGADPLDALKATPLWATLSAVQNNRVHVLGDAWGLGVSVTAADQILDDLVEIVFPES